MRLPAKKANTTPAAAQRGTLSLPQPVPTIPKNQEIAKPIVVAELVEQLRTANVGKRHEIIRQLSHTEENIVPELIKAMADSDPLVKSAVAEVLGNLSDAAVPAIPELVKMIDDRRRAIAPPGNIRILPKIPQANVKERRSPPIPPENPENLLRITAIAAIGKIGLPARKLATPPLTEALEDPDPWVKLNATWALAEIGASIPLLSYWLEALQDSNPNLRSSAAEIFQDSKSLLRKVLGAEADANTTTTLLIVVKDENFRVRNAAKEGLELLGTGALPGLIKSLKASEPIVRLEAAEVIGNLGEAAQSALPDLVALLEDTERYLPNGYGLIVIPPPASIYLFTEQSLYPLAPDNPDNLVRVNAAIALGKLGNRQAIPALTTALKDNNPWMGMATAWALRRLGETQGLPVVGRLLQHPDSSIQRAALYQLRGYGSQSAPYLLPYYRARLDSADDNTRNSAIIAIGKLGVAALDLVPKLRAFLLGNQKDSPGYAATTLGEIAQKTAIAWQDGSLSANQRQQAIAEFTQVLNIIQAPNAKFNREPIDRIRNALTILRGVTQ
ncbi:HEAT repeat domain-containing protein [Symplocastrum sp. BBK-W-15]|uniref:HEAT repeat domain-containing protein n=1 Tax=Limnofasciculus baicalensis BBK-W-15 TaxID=2699891 RepID=A0AAE3KR95_9CYAN|nr:HEAT repeat domain-containing protein [Limnofasciculus baicalensis BBK-W-15]